MRLASPDRLFPLLLLAAILVFLLPGFLPGRVFLPLDWLCAVSPWNAMPVCAGVQVANPVLSDQANAFFPWHALVRGEGLGGALWNRHAFAGSPIFANGQSALLYPPNWLHLLLPPTWSYVLLALLHWCVAVGFTWAFARRQVSAPAAALAAAGYGFSYAFVFSLGFPWGTAMALMPLLFWAVDQRRWVVLALATALELLAGQPQICLVAFFAASVYFLFQRPAFADVRRAVFATVAGAVCAAPQLLLLLQYGNWSAASRLRSEYNPLFYSPHTLLEFLTPAFFGTSSPTHVWASNEGGYFGLLPALLALTWVLVQRREAVRSPYLWIFLASLGIIYRLPPLSWVMALPYLRTVYVNKFWASGVFAGAMLAAKGLDFLQTRAVPARSAGNQAAGLDRPSRGYFLVFCSLAAVSALTLFGARWYFRDFITALHLQSFENGVLLCFGLFLVLAVVVLRLRPALAVAVVVIESFVYLGHYNVAAPAALLYPRPPLVDFLKRDPAPVRIMGNGVLPANTATVFGLDDVRGYDAITPWPYFRYMTAIDSSFPDLYSRLKLDPGLIASDTLFKRDRFLRPLEKWGEGYRDFLRRGYYWNETLQRVERPALLDLLNVKYFLLPRGASLPPGIEDYRLAYSGEADAYENPRAMPRAFVVGSWTAVGDPERALAAIRQADFNPRALAILCCDAALAASASADAGYRAAEIIHYSPTEVVARASGPGVLVLADSYYPGWRAAGFRLYRADYLFRGVLLPPGMHDVRFFYRPSLFGE